MKSRTVLYLNLHREWFAAVAAKTKRIEYRGRTPHWKARLENRKYEVINFRNGYATDAPEMEVEFLGVRRIKKHGKNVYAIRLGKILKIKRWQRTKPSSKERARLGRSGTRLASREPSQSGRAGA